MRRFLTFLSLLIIETACAQHYSTSSIFSHNDYAQTRPFAEAYELNVGFIEADVFLEGNKLLVAHTKEEQNIERTLETLYLKPIEEKIIHNSGNAYHDPAKHLTLMIDLKSEGISTLNEIVKQLKRYPKLIACKTLTISISGNVPDRSQWKNFPDFVFFDGRPGIDYTSEELTRISFISTSFKTVSDWNGSAALPEPDKQRIMSLRDEVHSKNIKLRFWGAPDNQLAWSTLMELQIDILGTDKVSDLADLIKYRSTSKDRQR
jgi:alkaline phosphatase